MADLVKDSVLPMPLQSKRFMVLESLLERLNGLSQHAIIMLVDMTHQSALEYFADHFSLHGDGWQFASDDVEQRQLIKQAIAIHRHKGTLWSIRQTLELLGYGDGEIQERFNYNEHNGLIKHNSKHRYGSVGSWTYYRIMMPRRISTGEAERIKVLLTKVAPLRCKLVSINLKFIYHNSAIMHDGSHKYDEAIARW